MEGSICGGSYAPRKIRSVLNKVADSGFGPYIHPYLLTYFVEQSPS